MERPNSVSLGEFKGRQLNQSAKSPPGVVFLDTPRNTPLLVTSRLRAQVYLSQKRGTEVCQPERTSGRRSGRSGRAVGANARLLRCAEAAGSRRTASHATPRWSTPQPTTPPVQLSTRGSEMCKKGHR